jgi:hypothetical protein
MKQATEFPCCLHDGWDNVRVRLGDDGLPLVITRDKISTWFEQSEIPMPENSDGLSDAELILKFAEPLKAKSCFRVISYADALYFSSKDALEVLKGLTLKDWTHNGCFSHYPNELRKILMEFALNPNQTNSNTLDPVAFLRQAIRERDEEIARKKADEEARAEADRLAAERELREQQEAREKLKGFLESIGDFEMHGPSSHDPDGDEAVTWLETWSARIIPFKECWSLSLRDSPLEFFVGRRRFCIQVNLSDGFDENVKKIIQWMVDNGAREPELKIDAA